MIPWFWYWAPQFHFPFSGSVTQRIEPDFFSNIRARAGDGDVEREAVDIASYGRQLGLITEVLLSQAEPAVVPRAKGEESLTRLKDIHVQVEQVKLRHRRADIESAVQALEKLRESNPAALALLLQRFDAARPRLAAPPPG